MHEFFVEIEWWYHKVGTLDTCVSSFVNILRQRAAFHLFDLLNHVSSPFMPMSFAFNYVFFPLIMYTTVNIHCGCWDMYQSLCKRMLTCYRYVGNCDCIGRFKVTYWMLGPFFCDRIVAVFLAVPILTEYVPGSGSSAMRTLSIWMYFIRSDRSVAGRMTHTLRHVHTHICLGIYELTIVFKMATHECLAYPLRVEYIQSYQKLNDKSVKSSCEYGKELLSESSKSV